LDKVVAVELLINGEKYNIADEPRRFLLYVLRDELGLTGTKYGCGSGYCGSCTVIVDGEARRSCITMVDDVAGQEIRTVESLAEIDERGEIAALHPIQVAFLDHQVPQCSWCMSGQMMTAVAFLERNVSPTDDEIVAAMGENYCRCGCYVRIRRAVADAAAKMEKAQ
jgi:isoquinoline 1-oxidoreductase alpha subunit